MIIMKVKEIESMYYIILQYFIYTYNFIYMYISIGLQQKKNTINKFIKTMIIVVMMILKDMQNIAKNAYNIHL